VIIFKKRIMVLPTAENDSNFVLLVLCYATDGITYVASSLLL
jgi:hypothetical protein